LPKILDQQDSKLVVISDIATLFCDSDIGAWEAKRIFNRVTLSLWNLARHRDVILMATSLPSRNKMKTYLEHFLFGRADVVAQIKEGNPHAKISLTKHPSRPAATAELFLGEPSTQSSLEDFMEA
jgi:hypothetical protein